VNPIISKYVIVDIELFIAMMPQRLSHREEFEEKLNKVIL